MGRTLKVLILNWKPPEMNCEISKPPEMNCAKANFNGLSKGSPGGLLQVAFFEILADTFLGSYSIPLRDNTAYYAKIFELFARM